jgi:Putative transposase/Transposase zinc-binding domain
MAAKVTIKQILLSNQNWWNFYEKHKANLRPAIVTSVVKLLSCKHLIRGHKLYSCSNPECSHTKYVCYTCKCKLCSSCGKKATELWIQKQNDTLPVTTWQHITFTMPSELWDFFWYNRSLLNKIAKIAARCIMSIAAKKGVVPGIFIAIHTFGRDLKRNVHIHLSTTLGGLSLDGTQWKKLFFRQATLMQNWRYEIIRLFRQNASQLLLPPAIQKALSHAFTFNEFLNQLYQKIWVVHCSKPSNDHKKNVDYLSRYVKRPAIAESKLRHYDGNSVTFSYLDHNTKTYRKYQLSAEEFIARLIQHIPDLGFRMIRYYGFLANRVRAKLLPLVYKLLNQINRKITPPTSFEILMQKTFNINPFICILCGQRLIFTAAFFGNSGVAQLLMAHKELAHFQKI